MCNISSNKFIKYRKYNKQKWLKNKMSISILTARLRNYTWQSSWVAPLDFFPWYLLSSTWSQPFYTSVALLGPQLPSCCGFVSFTLICMHSYSMQFNFEKLEACACVSEQVNCFCDAGNWPWGFFACQASVLLLWLQLTTLAIPKSQWPNAAKAFPHIYILVCCESEIN